MIHPGMLIKNRYRVIKPLGKGGFGKTFAVDDNGIIKVLKVLNLSRFHSQEGKQKAISLFQREAGVLSRLQHPGIPKVEQDGYFLLLEETNQTLHCLVMEKIEGMTLKQWLTRRENQPITQEQAITWLRQLSEILAQVHEQELIHRDLKPSNIMLRQNGQLVLIDFGAVRELTDTYLQRQNMNVTGTVIISAGYTPTEQAEGQAVPQSDFFALGRTFVYLLTGKSPTDFERDSRTGKLCWRDSAPQVSKQFADLVDYMMATFPGRRPQTAQMIVRCLEEIISPKPLLPPPPPLRKNKQETSQLPAKKKAFLGLIADFFSGNTSSSSSVSNISTSCWQKARFYRTLSGHLDIVKSIAVSPDGQIIASGSYDKTIKLWKLNNGELLHTIDGHKQRVTCVAISPDSRTLVSSSEDTTIKLWTLGSGKLKKTLVGHSGRVRCIAFSPNGQILISCSGMEVKLWAVLTGRLLSTLEGHSHSIRLVAFSPDGKNCVIGGLDGSLELWNPHLGKRLHSFSGHADAITSVVFSPDGQTIASGRNKTIELWNCDTGERLRSFSGQSSGAMSVAFSPDGKTLAGGNGKNIELWHLPSRKRLCNLSRHSKPIQAIAFSPDGRILVSGGHDKTIKIWQAVSSSR
ncbi:MAG: serine/threonine-protein kinase [Coleofasciculaceae cyanobacterium]